MNDLVDFKNAQIDSLHKRILLLETWLLEVTSQDCPDDYRRIVRNELLKSK